ncbi:hypothetical protein BH23GEM4_BH23GEM4_03290 [soil metagenome]
MRGYTTREVAEVLGLSPSQVRSYARSDLLAPERGPRREFRFAFQDIILLRAARELRAAEIPPRRIRGALRSLREQLPAGRPLSAVHITADGDRILVRDQDAVWDPESQQVHIDFSVAELASRAAPFARRASRREVEEDDLGADEWYDLAFDLEAVAPDEAVHAYRRALALDPDHADSHLNLGRLLHEGGELRAAEQHYRHAVELEPESATAAFNLGVALEDQGRAEEGIAAYGRALDCDPNHAPAHFNLSRLYEEAGRVTDALRHLAEYRRLLGRG